MSHAALSIEHRLNVLETSRRRFTQQLVSEHQPARKNAQSRCAARKKLCYNITFNATEPAYDSLRTVLQRA